MTFFDQFTQRFNDFYQAFLNSLPILIVGLFTLIIFLIVVAYIRKLLIKSAKNKAEDPLLINFLNKLFRTVNIILGMLLFLFIIGQGALALSLLGVGSISAFIIGFAFKDIGEHFLAGIVLAFKRPFRIGDTILTGNVEGNIVDMSLRDTHIKTFDGKDVYVPNGQIIKEPLFNYTIDGFLRRELVIGIDYNSNFKQVHQLILNCLKNIPGVLTNDKVPHVAIKNFGPSSINVFIRYWIDTFDKSISGIDIQNNVYNKIHDALRNAQVNMPGDIIELKNYNSELFKLEKKDYALL